MDQNSRKELTLTRIFDAPRDLVFKAWTDPKLIAEWWGPEGFTNPVVELDVRPGGAMLIHMQGPDGVVYPNKGVFNEVIVPERLVFTSGAIEDDDGIAQLEDVTTVMFEEVDGKTKVTVHAEVIKAGPGTEFALAGMQEGWTQSLDRLGRALIAMVRR